MNIKMLLFPTLLVLAVVLSVGYIKPDIESILTQRTEESDKQEALRKVESVASNIVALTNTLNSKSNLEALIKRYVPLAIDQERSLDVINFLAQQNGIVIRGISIQEDKRAQKSATPQDSGGDDAPSAEASTGDEGADPSTLQPLHQYAVQVEVMGTYANLRNFYDRLYRTDRWRVVSDILLSQPKETDRFRQDQEIIPADFLLSTITFTFPYTPSLNAGNALTQELFQKNTLDFGIANQLNDFVNSPVSDLSPGNPGRSNPFEAIP